ncbi:hypothetical protein FN846DRAFT_902028 [Sphaerosporella brunnea]|uniref:C2H2-type domain-containing protein n=1 Tax=Sphaerosporella brunnea TaxID=1250544 RepID=A0A5J5FBB1_9PEZI|nr:hypothetical protein FN846DRAFT_902028 [Sphaerosporella brunnea]
MISSSPHSQFFTPTTNITSSATDNFYYYGDDRNLLFPPSSAATASFSSSKRAKVEPSFDFTTVPSTFDCPPLIYPTAMPQALHRSRPVAPHINLQRASEPASPVTIASTLSTHSTPSPSPQRVTIVSDNTPDFSLYEEGFPNLQEHQLKQQQRFSFNTSNPSPTSFSGSVSWPMCSPHSMGFPKQQQQYFQQPTFTGSFGHRSDEEELPALSPSRGNTSRPPVSEADMPVTPIHSPLHGDASRCVQAPAVRENTYIEDWMEGCLQELDNNNNNNVPKLARTVSDAVQDELFNPGIAPGTTRSLPEHPSETNSQLPTLFQQAQNQHAMARGTPSVQPVLMIRDRSPFRANSPFHPARTQQEIVTPPPRTTAFLNPGAYTSARARREKDLLRDAELLREQMKKEYEEMQQTPKTISPKDAYIEYHEPEGNGIHGSLFSSSQNDNSYSQHSAVDAKSESDGTSYHGSIHGDDEGSETEHSYASNSRRASDVNMDYSMPTYHGAQQFGDHLNVRDYGWGENTSSREGSDGSRRSDPNYELTSVRRPEDTMANDGAYSCTVSGCTQRFSTASKMSKHRREAHRNNTPMGRDAPMKSLLQGPSRCARINPTTGKPCNTVFSRPYDLTRHEDTIHNTARQKVRCEICNDEKTFSRHDALTRHKKVKHGIDK